jgi:hypothetical protein
VTRTRRRGRATAAGGRRASSPEPWSAAWLTDRVRITGSDRSPLVIIFGIPILCVIAGAVIGALISGTREVSRIDAPVRDERFRASGRAATSAEGQLPGSPVAPRVAGRDDEGRPPPG